MAGKKATSKGGKTSRPVPAKRGGGAVPPKTKPANPAGK